MRDTTNVKPSPIREPFNIKLRRQTLSIMDASVDLMKTYLKPRTASVINVLDCLYKSG